MEKEACVEIKVYVRPEVLSHQEIRFETAQSWNQVNNCNNGDDSSLIFQGLHHHRH